MPNVTRKVTGKTIRILADRAHLVYVLPKVRSILVATAALHVCLVHTLNERNRLPTTCGLFGHQKSAAKVLATTYALEMDASNPISGGDH
jgi:hypothetical protein